MGATEAGRPPDKPPHDAPASHDCDYDIIRTPGNQTYGSESPSEELAKKRMMIFLSECFHWSNSPSFLSLSDENVCLSWKLLLTQLEWVLGWGQVL
ncbi:hypothetical protein DPEC_G00173320 [Dallia pectoralis]|uniref:Uncharacterized protein n=1 Tax=Dallia pectoralis TaxID=75939 RepID=A0ACC2GDK3_DALPE|nr:hypothetical protein DPEC_G00173320 [Dallia pectoralis]